MVLKTESAHVNASIEEVFEFLSIASNLEKLLPEDKISDFQSNESGCSFKVQGGIIIPLLYTQKTEFTTIKMQSGDKAPFNYTLAIHLVQQGDTCKGHIEFEANINMFMKMMVEKPLTNLFEIMTQKLQKNFAAN
jgi:carbon monoxide dehydrogenase subunit G